jgi:hypothetical protein
MIRPAGGRHFDQVIPLHTPRIETLVVLAQHRGRCMPPAGCRGPIRKGEAIQRVDGRWMHEECVPADAIDAVPERREAA